jgi:hypothetical protein
MSLARKIGRNALKKVQGNNKIKNEWQQFISYKYSVGELEELRKRNKKRRK